MINFYSLIKKDTKNINPNYEKHGISVPFRLLIASPSGSGKTNALLNLIAHLDKTFNEIIICVKSADEPLYNMLIEKLKNVSVFENGDVPDISNYSSIDKTTKRLKKNDNKQRLIIFDDLILDKEANKKACEYYIKARKLNFSMCYIGQSYFQIPKMVRDNCQYFMLGRNLLKKDLRMILNIFPTDLNLNDFTNLYNELTNEELDTILIDVNKKTIKKNIIGEVYKL